MSGDVTKFFSKTGLLVCVVAPIWLGKPEMNDGSSEAKFAAWEALAIIREVQGTFNVH